MAFSDDFGGVMMFSVSFGISYKLRDLSHFIGFQQSPLSSSRSSYQSPEITISTPNTTPDLAIMNFLLSAVSASSDSLDLFFLENMNGDESISGILSPFPSETFGGFNTVFDSIAGDLTSALKEESVSDVEAQEQHNPVVAKDSSFSVEIDDFLSIDGESNTDQDTSVLDSLLADADPLTNGNVPEKDVSSSKTTESAPYYALDVKDFFEKNFSEDFIAQFSTDLIEPPTTSSDEENPSLSPMINNALDDDFLSQLKLPDLVGNLSSPDINANGAHEALLACSCQKHKSSESHHNPKISLVQPPTATGGKSKKRQFDSVEDTCDSHTDSKRARLTENSSQKKGIFIPENAKTPSVPTPTLEAYRALNNVSLDQVLDSSRHITNDKWLYESANPTEKLTPYSPRVYRYFKSYAEFRKSTGKVVERQGLCPYCPLERIHNEHTSFYDLNSSEYALHLSLCHGVFTTGYFVQQPTVHKMGLELKARGEPRLVECVECPYDNCKKAFKVNRKQIGSKSLGAYIRHVRKCHMITKNKRRS
ncbi:unnamed protein product [Ambrosiozyma monospora]|uniref:Unnamed protein product n=1 Tax=Ambrosiozyma monospora TaxID=43982 RepID=A0ACB5SWB6_AMBMO|nr:unnamed protein product [Ambrosiozyma monospora]